MTTSNEHNNAPAVPEQELSALLTTSLPYMTPVGRARLGQDIAQLYSSVSAPAVPQGEAWGYVDHRGCAIKFKNDRHRSELANAIECGGLEYLHTSPAAKLGNDIESALESLVERCNNDAGMSNEDAVIHAEAVLERVYNSRSATPAPAPAQYKDSTPQLSVGESSFESWFESYNPANKGDKQRSRDAYAAGMGDPLVAAAPAQDEPLGHFRAEPFGWTDCAKDDEGAIALYERPQEVGLTDDEITQVCSGIYLSDYPHGSTSYDIALARAIIAALRAKGGK